MFGHHGSKAAGNMVGHLLGYDLKERGVPIAMIHVSTVALVHNDRCTGAQIR